MADAPSSPLHRTTAPGEISLDHLGMSENSVPLKPMVNDHYPY